MPLPEMPEPRAYVFPALGADELRSLRHVAEHARAVKSEGATYGSLTDEGLDYSAVPGRAMPTGAWQLYKLLGHTARALTGRELRIIEPGDDDADYACALNVLGPGQSYELHRDTAAWNLIVFVTEADGAAFHLCDPGMPDEHPHPLIRFHPVAGLGILFDGVTLPHYTSPNESETASRVALVCQYPDPAAVPIRSSAYLDHIYGRPADGTA
jgi:hypothetical protein